MDRYTVSLRKAVAKVAGDPGDFDRKKRRNISMEAYTYKPLDETKQEIRYMTLLPRSRGKQLEISLTHVSLQQFQVEDTDG